jgi:hypothetical protein
MPNAGCQRKYVDIDNAQIGVLVEWQEGSKPVPARVFS